MTDYELRAQRAKAFPGNVVILAGAGGTRDVLIADVEKVEVFAGYGRTRKVPVRFTDEFGAVHNVRDILLP
jgi:hypothetical protein